MPKTELSFSVDSQLLGELGERLVTRNYVALAELIKNAYDADATEIVIKFIKAKKGPNQGEIHISDNGHGMSFQEVSDYWMRIATTSKVRAPVSPKYGRRKTGNKGVGRFACRRLAKKLVMETVGTTSEKRGLEKTKVTFNWGDFKPGTTLTQIPCVYTRDLLINGKTGLSLILTNLVERWTDSDFNLLRRHVLGLSIVKGVRREGFEEDPGFEIKLEAPEFPSGEGILSRQLLDAGWGKLEGEINNQGICNLKLEAKEIGLKEFGLDEAFENLKGITFEIAWLPMQKSLLRDTRIITKTGILDLLTEQGGVRVYLDGFRVYPYGDAGNDWLRIDADVARRKGRTDDRLSEIASKLGVDPLRAMLNSPRNQQLYGNVVINSGPSMPLQVKLDREGFIEDSSFEDLVTVLRLSIQWMVLHYNEFLLVTGRRELYKKAEELEGLLGDKTNFSFSPTEETTPIALKALTLISDEAKTALKTLPEEQRRKAEIRLNAASEFVKQSYSISEIYLGILKAVASTGSLMFNFSHEIKNLMARLDTHANTIDRMLNDVPKIYQHDFSLFAQSLRKTRDRLDQQIQLFGTLSRTSGETKRQLILLKPIVDEVMMGFQYLIEEYGINKPVVEIPEDFKIGPILEVEIYSIIVNLISNAVKANLSGNGRNIYVKVYSQNGKKVLAVCDDGIGLEEKYWEEVFKPLNADPAGNLYSSLKRRVANDSLAALGRGSGIGLNIVKTTVESYNGSIRFTKPETPWKTCIEVLFP